MKTRLRGRVEKGVAAAGASDFSPCVPAADDFEPHLRGEWNAGWRPYRSYDSMPRSLISLGAAIVAIRLRRVLRKIFRSLPADLVREGDRPCELLRALREVQHHRNCKRLLAS